MEFFTEVMAFFAANKVVLLVFALSLSEVLGLIPGIKSNSIFQLVVAFIKKISPKLEAK
jgi:hypothetical protein